MWAWTSIFSWGNKDEEAVAGFDPDVDYYSEDFPQGELTIKSADGTVTYQGESDGWKPNTFAENLEESYNETIEEIKNSISNTADDAKNTTYALAGFALLAIFLIKK